MRSRTGSVTLAFCCPKIEPVKNAQRSSASCAIVAIRYAMMHERSGGGASHVRAAVDDDGLPCPIMADYF
jgi:hypothetical protein